MTTQPLDPLLALSSELPELPRPAVYMRDTDGRLEAKIGGDRPPDRSGGYSTPWGFFYTADQMRAYATEAAAYWKEMHRAANARGDGLSELMKECLPALDAWARDGERRFTDGNGTFHLMLGDNHYRAMQLMDRVNDALTPTPESN